MGVDSSLILLLMEILIMAASKEIDVMVNGILDRISSAKISGLDNLTTDDLIWDIEALIESYREEVLS